MEMTLLSALTICNNIEHMFISLTTNPENKHGFVITWNNDHPHHPWMPLISWEPEKNYDIADVLKEIEVTLRELQNIYQQKADEIKQNKKADDKVSKMINGFVASEGCPLTNDIIDKIMVELRRVKAVDVGKLLS